MKRVRRMLGIWDTGKVTLGMLALLALWGVGELEQTEKAVTAVLWGGFLGLLSLSFLGAARRQRQYAACAPGRVVLRSWRGREQEITAGAVGEILFTGTCLRLLDLRGRRLGQIAWANRRQQTAGADALLALLHPARSPAWDREAVCVSQSSGVQIWTGASAAAVLAAWLAVGFFLRTTGQLSEKSMEAWLGLLGLLSAWSAWRLLKVFRRRILADGDGIWVIPALGGARELAWGTFALTWTEQGRLGLPGADLAGYGRGLFALCLALRDHGLLTADWDSMEKRDECSGAGRMEV